LLRPVRYKGAASSALQVEMFWVSKALNPMTRDRAVSNPAAEFQ
jgi:hypothetical protein